MKKKNYSIITSMIMGAVFVALFIVNASTLVPKSDKSSSNLSLTAFLATASADDAPAEVEPPLSKTKCGQDNCSKDVALGIPPYQSTVTYYGHYTHCQNGGPKDNCTSSSCDVECDAKK